MGTESWVVIMIESKDLSYTVKVIIEGEIGIGIKG